ncbi:MAG: hypothetical protein R3232_04480, partial [Clostridia bacterium]|nr:hypothetical protein [Clostridia bacterium]
IGKGGTGYLIDKMQNKYLEHLAISDITKFNENGYALAYSIFEINETTQDKLYYMIHIEQP